MKPLCLACRKVMDYAYTLQIRIGGKLQTHRAYRCPTCGHEVGIETPEIQGDTFVKEFFQGVFGGYR